MHVLIGARSIFEFGGMQRVTVGLANNLSQRGHQVTLVGEKESENANVYYSLDPRVTLVNINSHYQKYHLKYVPQKLAFKFLLYSAKILPSLSKSSTYNKVKWAAEYTCNIDAWRNLCVVLEPDIVLGVSPESFTVLSLALKETAIPFVVNNHSNPWEDYSVERWDSNPVDVILRKAAPELAAANTVLLPEYKKYFSHEVQQRTYVIPNTVEQIAPEKRARSGRSDGVKTIIASGRLVSVKDQKTLVEAFSQLNKDFPDWQVKIFGEGCLRNDLQRQIEELQLTDRVYLCNYSNNIFDEYRASHILAMPSLFEGFGLSITEAMANALPCVGFENASGVNSLIKHGVTGYLADGNNRVNSFSYYLGKLMEDGKLRQSMGNAGVEFVRQFEPKRIYDLWEKNLKEIVLNNTKLASSRSSKVKGLIK